MEQERLEWSLSSVKDIYLDNVRFELNSAQLKEIGGKRFCILFFK